jgi:hypothetical protein
MPPVGFGPTISELERAKTVRALDRAATAIGKNSIQRKFSFSGDICSQSTLIVTVLATKQRMCFEVTSHICGHLRSGKCELSLLVCVVLGL